MPTLHASVIRDDDPGEELRTELRSWLGPRLTPQLVAAGHGMPTEASMALLRTWNRELADAGWAAPAWPSDYGGRDAGIDEQLAYFEVMSETGAPGPVNSIGVANIAPAIMQYGTAEQRDRFLRPLLRGDEIWSQGMSEPDAGSDLASLRTTAVLDGDHFTINGQKTWNSLGHYADWCQLYVRTDPGSTKHRGISCLLVDLGSDGIEERPIRTITGESSFSELFFSDVRVPSSALLGPQDQGWTVAMTTLSYERAGVARLHLTLSKRLGELLADPTAQSALADPRLRNRVAAVHSDIACMRWMTDRSFAQMRAGQPTGASGSLSKLAWGRTEQKLAALAVDLLGMSGTLEGPWATNLCAARQTSIAGGTTEINLNIVAEHGLGLPREATRKG
ncbi:MAG: acyl-CoA dehydrogenase family protein [Actinomycetota bacterium]|nr:acyl-CoA dehydrogenase family protein [Actinomycetota bacterium]